MSAVGSDDEFSFRPRPVERPRTFHRADHIVTPLYDHSGDLPDSRSVAEQLVVGFQETFIDKVVGLDARESEGKLVLFVVAGEVRVG